MGHTLTSTIEPEVSEDKPVEARESSPPDLIAFPEAGKLLDMLAQLLTDRPELVEPVHGYLRSIASRSLDPHDYTYGTKWAELIYDLEATDLSTSDPETMAAAFGCISKATYDITETLVRSPESDADEAYRRLLQLRSVIGDVVGTFQGTISGLAVEKLDMQPLYDAAPEPIQRGVQLLNCLCGDKLAAAHLMAMIQTAGVCLGKEVRARNFGRLLYPNMWGVALAESGANKAYPGAIDRALRRA